MRPEAAMRSLAIVVIRELGQYAPQVALVDHDQVIEAFGPNVRTIRSAAALAFGVRGGVRTPAMPRLASCWSKSPP